MQEKKTVLVTGATGYLGQFVVQRLAKIHKVSIIKLRSLSHTAWHVELLAWFQDQYYSLKFYGVGGDSASQHCTSWCERRRYPIMGKRYGSLLCIAVTAENLQQKHWEAEHHSSRVPDMTLCHIEGGLEYRWRIARGTWDTGPCRCCCQLCCNLITRDVREASWACQVDPLALTLSLLSEVTKNFTAII